MLNIGRCSTTLAEMWGVYYGLYMAWDRRFVQVDLEVDPEIVVGFLHTSICASHPLSFMVRMCYWISEFLTYKEVNHLADGFSNYAFFLSLGLHVFASPSITLFSIMRDDGSGTACPRRV